jgi:hypothetical protein
VLLYQSEDGVTRIEVRLENDTVWLPQRALADLFQTTKQNISFHIQHIFEEGELSPEGTVKQYLTVQSEGNRQIRRALGHYNLDVIITVGCLRYRVNSRRGTQFRIWANLLLVVACWFRITLEVSMNLTSEQVQAIREGAHVPIVPPEVGEECIVLRRDAYEKIKHLLYDDGDVDPARFYPLVSAIMAEDDAEDPALESYQKYKR